MSPSPKQVAMLRWVARQPNGAAGVPYRKGSTATAQALYRRGLIHLWIPDGQSGPWGCCRHMAITAGGRAYFAALDAPTTP